MRTLAVPCGARWLKIAGAMDYVAAVKPSRVIPVHEMVLSVIGKNIANERLAAVTEQHGGEYFVLDPSQSIDL